MDNDMLATIDEDVDNSDEYDSEATLDISIPIEGATEQQKWMFAELAKLFEQNFEMLVNKNLDYGSTFLKRPLKSNDSPFDDPVDDAVYGLHTRSGDKRDRFEEQFFKDGEDRVSENSSETALDNANYWMLMAWTLEYGHEGIAMLSEQMSEREMHEQEVNVSW